VTHVKVLSVDPARCQGHARCLAFAPDVFEFDDEGYSFVPEDRSRYAELPDDVRQAVANCPERAIFVTEDSGG
jgi:ferredoxin